MVDLALLGLLGLCWVGFLEVAADRDLPIGDPTQLPPTPKGDHWAQLHREE